MNLPRKRWPLRERFIPASAALNVTYACDMNCVGCNRACYIKPAHTPAMRPEKLQAFFAEAESLRLPFYKVRFVGGEPTLAPHFMDLIAIAAEYGRHNRGCRIVICSNLKRPAAKAMVAEARARFPNVHAMAEYPSTADRVFPWETRTMLIHPRDVGAEPCPHPCPWLQGRGKWGFGVDQLGYHVCAMGGTIDSLLHLNTRATSLAQLLNKDFVRHQAQLTCSHCGMFMGYNLADCQRMGQHNGSPVSPIYQQAIDALRRLTPGP